MGWGSDRIFRTLIVLLSIGALAAPLAAQTLPGSATEATGNPAEPSSSFEIAARARGTPDIPGLNIIWLIPWGSLIHARDWRNIVVHQSEGPAGSAWRAAVAQTQRQNRKGATIWVETDGTVYWGAAEFAVPNHIRDGNRADNKFIDNSTTFQQITNDNSIGVEFVGNYPNVRKPVTAAQAAAWRILVRVLQTRYSIPNARVYAHNWIDYKDARYCEGCELARLARTQAVETASRIDPAR